MGKIRKILETELVGGTQSTDVYPVTSTKAVYDTNNKVLDDYIQHLKKTSTFDDFVNYLSEILGISKQWASVKLSGKTSFTDKELAVLNKVLDFEPVQLKKALGG